MKKRTIAFFTGNRAEYGLQFPILRAVARHPDLDYRLIVSGAHLDPVYGMTSEEIKQDGFTVHSEVRIKMNTGRLSSTAEAIGDGVVRISKALGRLKPDVVVVYADRFEGFAAVIAASQMSIPTAHVEGGDLTEGGALDDSVRHAMTKLSHLHFTTNREASNRIVGMGEEAWRVHTVGLPAIDLISEEQFANRDEVVERLRLDLTQPMLLFTQHPITTEADKAEQQIIPSLTAIKNLAVSGVQCILTYPNNDEGSLGIIKKLESLNSGMNPNIRVHRSLGRHIYHGVLALARDPAIRIACVGNSSSGLKETPAFSCPTLNIGSRQEGRLRGANVLDTSYDAHEIEAAIKKCLFDDEFRSVCRQAENPYWMGGAGSKVAGILAGIELGPNLIKKKMMLRGEACGGWFR